MNNTTVAVLPFYQLAEPYILTAFGLIFSALMTWIVALIQKHTNLKFTAEQRAAVQQAGVNAAGRILAAEEGNVANLSIDMHSPQVAAQVPLVMDMVGDAVNHLGMTPDRVAALIAGKVGLVQASAAPAVTASPTTAAGATS